MAEPTQNIHTTREKLGLTIQQVADETNVRADIIADIENSNTSQLPAAYIQSFINELVKFYDEVSNDKEYLASIIENKEQPTALSFNAYKDRDGSIPLKEFEKKTLTFDTTAEFASVTLQSEQQQSIEKSEISNVSFVDVSKPQYKTTVKQQSSVNKKRFFMSSLRLSLRDAIIYAVLFIFLFSVLYFAIFHDKNNSYISTSEIKTKSEDSDQSSVANVKDNELLDYFTPFDSLVLRAVCKDTAWIKVVIDNSKTDELLLTPDMQIRWSAVEQIVLSTSNVGGIKFYKNDTLLPNLGATGTMVRNIVLKREGVANVSPLTNSNETTAVNNIRPSETRIVPSTPDTTRTEPQKKIARKKKAEEPPPQPIMDFSAPPTKPPILNKEKD